MNSSVTLNFLKDSEEHYVTAPFPKRKWQAVIIDQWKDRMSRNRQNTGIESDDLIISAPGYFMLEDRHRAYKDCNWKKNCNQDVSTLYFLYFFFEVQWLPSTRNCNFSQLPGSLFKKNLTENKTLIKKCQLTTGFFGNYVNIWFYNYCWSPQSKSNITPLRVLKSISLQFKKLKKWRGDSAKNITSNLFLYMDFPMFKTLREGFNFKKIWNFPDLDWPTHPPP